MGPTVTELAAKAGVIEADLGVIFTINGFISIIGAVPSGWMVDRLPGHIVLVVSMALEVVGFLLIPHCTSMAGLMTAFGGVALTWNILNTAGNSYVLVIAREQQMRSGALVNMVNALFGAGSLAAPLLAELAHGVTRSVLPAYTAVALLTALSAAAFLCLPSPSLPGAAATAADSSGGSGSGGGGGRKRRPRSWTARPLLPLLLWMMLFMFFSVGTEVAIGGWVFTWAVSHLGAGEARGHLLNAAYWGAFTGGRVAASAAAAALSPRAMLLCSLPLAAAGAGAALAAPPAALAGWPALLCTVLIGLGVSTGFANGLSLLDAQEPVTGTVNGLLGGVAGAGCMLLPLAVALIAKHSALGYQGLMWGVLASIGAQFVCLGAALWVGGRLDAAEEERRGELDAALLAVAGAAPEAAV